MELIYFNHHDKDLCTHLYKYYYNLQNSLFEHFKSNSGVQLNLKHFKRVDNSHCVSVFGV